MIHNGTYDRDGPVGERAGREPRAVARVATDLAENEDTDRETLQEYVTRIDESHARMEAIIDDVLALAREGESIDDAVEVDLEELATAAWSNVDHGDATLSVVGTRAFEADRNRLLRALENLFRNAIEHGGSTSTVTVEVGPTESGFYVADDGNGIPPDAVDDVFEYGKTTAEAGTGFGLAIVEAIVTAHDWTIEVDETDSEGATFVVDGIADETAGTSEGTAVEGGANSVPPSEGTEAGTVETDDGWRTEFSIPWDEYGVRPIVGHRLGLDVHITVGDRDTKFGWFDESDDAWVEPRKLATVELGE